MFRPRRLLSKRSSNLSKSEAPPCSHKIVGLAPDERVTTDQSMSALGANVSAAS
jgi:hypothetical protein